MKTLIALALALTSFASAYAPQARASGPAGTRGTVVAAAGHAVKAVTAGPAVVHGYSGFAGGAIFVTASVTGTDADCAAALAGARPAATTLGADHVAQIPVGAGQLACLVTDTTRSFELLWHALPTAAPSATLVASNRK